MNTSFRIIQIKVYLLINQFKLFKFHINHIFHIIDILSFTISEFSDAFVKSMNQEAAAFKSQFLLEKILFIDKGFSCNIKHNSKNEVTFIV